MTKRNARYAVAVLLFLIASQAATAGTLKKRNGEVVVGQIKSLVVTRGSIAKMEGYEDTWAATYWMIEGDDIISIDENGVRQAGTAIILSAAQKNRPPGDAEVVASAMNRPLGKSASVVTPSGAQVFIFVERKRKERVTTFPPIGQAMMGSDGELVIVPSIKVNLEDGSFVSVPVEDLVHIEAPAPSGAKTRRKPPKP